MGPAPSNQRVTVLVGAWYRAEKAGTERAKSCPGQTIRAQTTSRHNHIHVLHKAASIWETDEGVLHKSHRGQSVTEVSGTLQGVFQGNGPILRRFRVDFRLGDVRTPVLLNSSLRRRGHRVCTVQQRPPTWYPHSASLTGSRRTLPHRFSTFQQ